MASEKSASVAWQQFLVGKRSILAEYDRAYTHAQTQPVATHHGNVAEAAVRNWLTSFLPKTFGVTSGFIRSQNITRTNQSAHHDVIIYDQLQAPILWIEENEDRSEAGRSRIIPVEFVKAIIEVKAAFNRRSIEEAVGKLTELRPFMEGIDAANEPYPKYLQPSSVFCILCYELRRDDAESIIPLNIIRDISFNRPFYGTVILRGEGLSPDSTAIVRQLVGKQPDDRIIMRNNLLNGLTITASNEINRDFIHAMMMWTDINFADFAFDILALLKGIYRPGFSSSLHGLDLKQFVPNK